MHTCKLTRIFLKCFEVWSIIIYGLMTNEIAANEDPKN